MRIEEINGFETINRDREDEGRAPLRVWLLANANDIYNPIFKDLKATKLKQEYWRSYYDNRRN